MSHTVRFTPEARDQLDVIEAKREAAKLEALRDAAGVGFADLDEGRFLDFSSFDDLEDHLTRTTEQALLSKPR